MRKYFIIMVLLTKVAVAQNKTTTIYLIRHAEKADNSKNPNLSEMGSMHASHWDDVFSAVHFDAIYSTNYNRTLKTAEPTALTQKIAVTTYDPKDFSLEKIKKDHSGQTILIVGHSNTIPDLVNKLIGQNVYPIIEETTFGNLYMITINGEIVNHQLLKSL
jgi:2,3-bisphosphoglycerate-dependent phosphoglycerate mutase